jgi:uncharacterized protein
VSRFYSAAALILLAAGRVAAWDVPTPPDRQFDDRASFVAPEAAAALEARLREARERSGREVVVAILPSLPDGAVLEDFTLRTAQAWRVGRKGLDDGVVLFVFASDRRLRLEVGYGLEAALPDATAKRILDEIVAPRLRAGDRAGALEAGIDAILTAAAGDALPAPAAPAPAPGIDLSSDDLHRLVAFPVLITLGVFLMGPRARGRGGEVSPGVALAVVVGLVGAVLGLLANADATLRGASLAAGAGLALASLRPGWPPWLAGRKSGKLEPGAARVLAGATALLALAHLASAFGWRASLAGFGLPALASFGVLQAFCALGIWRAKLWAERILYLGLGGLIAYAYVQPAVMDGRFPSFLLILPWAPIWTGLAALLNGLFDALGLQPRRWWYDESGRQSGLAGGSWSGRGYSGSSSSGGYSGGGGRFGGGGASGSW